MGSFAAQRMTTKNLRGRLNVFGEGFPPCVQGILCCRVDRKSELGPSTNVGPHAHAGPTLMVPGQKATCPLIRRAKGVGWRYVQAPWGSRASPVSTL